MSELFDNEDNKDKKEPVKGNAKRPPKRAEIGSNRVKYNDRHTIEGANRDPNFVYRLVNTDDSRYQGRIESLMKRGYTVCTDGEQLGDNRGAEASQIGSVVGKPVGHGVRGVLMKIRKDFYEEDQAIKQAEVDDIESGMVPDELREASDVYGDGLKIEDAQGTRMEVRHRR